MPNMAKRTVAALTIAAMVFAISLALTPSALTRTAAQQQYYALALSSGPGLQLSNQVFGTKSERDSERRLVCKYVIDVGVAKIGTRCTADRRHAAVAQR